MESTHLASPPVKIQTVIVSWTGTNKDLTKEMWSIMAENGLRWSEEGWTAIGRAQVTIHLNPVLGKDEAARSLAPMIEFGQKLKDRGIQSAKFTMLEFPSWYAFFDAFASQYVAVGPILIFRRFVRANSPDHQVSGQSMALASRLVNKANFANSQSQEELVEVLLKVDERTPGLLIMMTPPAAYKEGDGKTSINDAMRDSLYHATVYATWSWNATTKEKIQRYKDASESMDILRQITPHAAYSVSTLWAVVFSLCADLR